MNRHTDRRPTPKAAYGDKAIVPVCRGYMGVDLFMSSGRIIEKRGDEYFEIHVENPYVKQWQNTST